MLKSSIISLRGYQTYLKSSLKSFRSLYFLVLPAVSFLLLSFFEAEVAAFIGGLNPSHPDQGIVYYADLVRLVAAEILWLTFFLLLTWILTVYPSREHLQNVFKLAEKLTNDHSIILILFIFFITTLYVSYNALNGFASSPNEYAYLFQAEMFSRGKFWEPAHDLPGFFSHHNIAQHDGILVSRFPPGWPIFLSAAFETGIPPFIVNPVLSVLSLFVFYLFAKRIYGRRVAIWGLLALSFTGYYVFNSASYFSHVLCLLVTLLFVCNLYLYHENRRIIYGILAGFFLGMIALVRYYNGLLVFVPFFFYILYQYRLRSLYLFLWMAIGAMPLFAFLLSYNYAITGHAFLPVHFWAYPQEKLGFVNGHTFIKGVEHVIRWIALFFYWCSPGVLILYFIFIYRKLKSPAERVLHPEDWFMVMLLVGYFFYYEFGGKQYGPRFLFEALPFLILFVINKVFQMREKLGLALLLASLVYAVIKFPFISYREKRIVDEQRDLYDLVDKQKVSNAVILVSSSTSPTRPMAADELTRNDSRFLNTVIYARELPAITGQLMEYYGDRSFYRYVRPQDQPDGELIKIR